MLASAVAPMNLDAATIVPATTSIKVLASATQGTPGDLSLKDFKTLEAFVRAYYKDTPELAEIAKCESNFRQYDSKGAILHGTENPNDIGIMQINEHYNGENADKLGFDIYSIEGNLAYAKVLYDKFGLDPWSSSEKCWKPAVVAMKN